MGNNAWASGHILCGHQRQRNSLLAKIAQLPDRPYVGDFSIWQGIFHAPEEPNRAGYIITFGLSHKHFGDPDEMGTFLNFWEEFITDTMADELFIALEPSSIYSDDPFGKFYFQWEWHPVHGWSPDLKPIDGRWVFNGTLPIDTTWKSRFATEINDNKQPD